MRRVIALITAIGCSRERATIAPIDAEKAQQNPTETSVLQTSSPFPSKAGERVVVVGTVEPLIKSASGLWVSIPIRLPSGGTVTVARGKIFDWEPLVGKTASVSGLVRLSGTDGAMQVDLDDAHAPCAGVVPRCGVD